MLFSFVVICLVCIVGCTEKNNTAKQSQLNDLEKIVIPVPAGQEDEIPDLAEFRRRAGIYDRQLARTEIRRHDPVVNDAIFLACAGRRVLYGKVPADDMSNHKNTSRHLNVAENDVGVAGPYWVHAGS